MDGPLKHRMLPWDLVVFATVALVGLGYAVQRLRGTPVVDATSPALLVSGAMPIVELGCVDAPDAATPRLELDGQTTRVRLRGRFCRDTQWGQEGNPTLIIRNLSSGAKATIIFRGDGSRFVTDELAVQPGPNPVVVEWRATPESPVAVREAQLDVIRELGGEEAPSASTAAGEGRDAASIEAGDQKR
jgi:hypothetical protein